jgi:hypothetical protein
MSDIIMVVSSLYVEKILKFTPKFIQQIGNLHIETTLEVGTLYYVGHLYAIEIQAVVFLKGIVRSKSGNHP